MGSVAEERGGGRKHWLLCKVLCANDDEWRRHCLTVKHRIKQVGVAGCGGVKVERGVVGKIGRCKVLYANDDEWRRQCLTVKHRSKQVSVAGCGGFRV